MTDHDPARHGRLDQRIPRLPGASRRRGLRRHRGHRPGQRRYLTGFTGSNAALLVTAGRGHVRHRRPVPDPVGRAAGAAGVEATIAIGNDPGPELRDRGAGHHPHRPRGRRPCPGPSIAGGPPRRSPGPISCPPKGSCCGLRAVKDEGEVARLAAGLADRRRTPSPTSATDSHEGVTERRFRRELEDAMADHGADAPSFETIVASGPNGAKPHARPSDRAIGAGDSGELVVVDFGATVRRLPLGHDQDARGRCAVARPRLGCSTSSAASPERRASPRCGPASGVPRCRPACRDGHRRRRLGRCLRPRHGPRHRSRDPRVAASVERRPTDVLAPGHCVTVEPGVYLPEHGGVRIEDSLVVTATGSWPLTNAPYE